MTKRWRVAHFGTGHTGMLVLRQILRRPDLALVGHLVHSPDKVGRDSAQIAGYEPIGVLATDDFDAFCAIDADCVTYFATEFGRDLDAVIDQMCRLLESGKNVVTTTFVRLVYPQSLPPEWLTRLEKACAVGQSAFFGTGIAPGFTSDALPVYCASLCANPRVVRVAERVLQGSYTDPLSFAALGFGSTPTGDATDCGGDAWLPHFTGTMRMLADGLGWDLARIRGYREVALAERDYSFAAGEIPRGSVAAVRLRFDGIVAGEPRLQLSWVYTMPDDPVDTWEPARPAASTARRFTHIDIDGDPQVRVRLELTGGDLPGADATASRAVNAIAAVCNAAPTVHSALDLVVTPAGTVPSDQGDSP